MLEAAHFQFQLDHLDKRVDPEVRGRQSQRLCKIVFAQGELLSAQADLVDLEHQLPNYLTRKRLGSRPYQLIHQGLVEILAQGAVGFQGEGPESELLGFFGEAGGRDAQRLMVQALPVQHFDELRGDNSVRVLQLSEPLQQGQANSPVALLERGQRALHHYFSTLVPRKSAISHPLPQDCQRVLERDLFRNLQELQQDLLVSGAKPKCHFERPESGGRLSHVVVNPA